MLHHKEGWHSLIYVLFQLSAIAAVILPGERSQKNSYMRHIIGLYLYLIGVSRQQISVLNHLGLSISYAILAGHSRKNNHLVKA